MPAATFTVPVPISRPYGMVYDSRNNSFIINNTSGLTVRTFENSVDEYDGLYALNALTLETSRIGVWIGFDYVRAWTPRFDYYAVGFGGGTSLEAPGGTRNIYLTTSNLSQVYSYFFSGRTEGDPSGYPGPVALWSERNRIWVIEDSGLIWYQPMNGRFRSGSGVLLSTRHPSANALYFEGDNMYIATSNDILRINPSTGAIMDRVLELDNRNNRTTGFTRIGGLWFTMDSDTNTIYQYGGAGSAPAGAQRQPAPRNVRVSKSNRTITLAWDAPEGGATKYTFTAHERVADGRWQPVFESSWREASDNFTSTSVSLTADNEPHVYRFGLAALSASNESSVEYGMEYFLDPAEYRLPRVTNSLLPDVNSLPTSLTYTFPSTPIRRGTEVAYQNVGYEAIRDYTAGLTDISRLAPTLNNALCAIADDGYIYASEGGSINNTVFRYEYPSMILDQNWNVTVNEAIRFISISGTQITISNGRPRARTQYAVTTTTSTGPGRTLSSRGTYGQADFIVDMGTNGRYRINQIEVEKENLRGDTEWTVRINTTNFPALTTNSRRRQGAYVDPNTRDVYHVSQPNNGRFMDVIHIPANGQGASHVGTIPFPSADIMGGGSYRAFSFSPKLGVGINFNSRTPSYFTQWKFGGNPPDPTNWARITGQPLPEPVYWEFERGRRGVGIPKPIAGKAILKYINTDFPEDVLSKLVELRLDGERTIAVGNVSSINDSLVGGVKQSTVRLTGLTAGTQPVEVSPRVEISVPAALRFALPKMPVLSAPNSGRNLLGFSNNFLTVDGEKENKSATQLVAELQASMYGRDGFNRLGGYVGENATGAVAVVPPGWITHGLPLIDVNQAEVDEAGIGVANIINRVEYSYRELTPTGAAVSAMTQVFRGLSPLVSYSAALPLDTSTTWGNTWQTPTGIFVGSTAGRARTQTLSVIPERLPGTSNHVVLNEERGSGWINWTLGGLATITYTFQARASGRVNSAGSVQRSRVPQTETLSIQTFGARTLNAGFIYYNKRLGDLWAADMVASWQDGEETRVLRVPLVQLQAYKLLLLESEDRFLFDNTQYTVDYVHAIGHRPVIVEIHLRET